MLITCDKCGKSYQVNETRLPAQGARIKCPKCSNVILIRLNNNEPAGKSITVADTDMPSVQLDSTLNPSTSQEMQTSSAAPSEETWKIRHAGLTYTFHDLSSLQDWLKGRATLEDVKVAKGEDEWKELGDYSEVMTTELITKFFPLGDVPKTPKNGPSLAAVAPVPTTATPVPQPAPQAAAMNFGVANASKNTMRNVAKSRSEQSKQKQATNNAIKTLIVGIVVACIVLACLHFMGFSFFSSKPEVPAGYHIEVVDGVEKLVSNDLLGSPEPTHEEDTQTAQTNTQPTQPDEASAPDVAPPVASDPSVIDYEEAQKLVNAEIERRLGMARENVKKRNWPVAQTILLSLTEDYPDNIEAKELLAKTYRSLGQNEKAEALAAEIKALKNL